VIRNPALLVLMKLPNVSGWPTRSTSLNVRSSTVLSSEVGPRKPCDVTSATIRISVFSRRASGTSANVLVGAVNTWPMVGARHQRVGVPHSAPRVELEPGMRLGLGQELRIVRGIGSLRPGGDVTDCLGAGRKHRQDQMLGLAHREITLNILRRDSRGAHQRHAQAGDVERVARARPSVPRAPRTDPV